MASDRLEGVFRGEEAGDASLIDNKPLLILLLKLGDGVADGR